MRISHNAHVRNLLAIISVLLPSCFSSIVVVAQEAAKLEHFEAKIRPVLVQHCYRCHSTETGKSKGGLQLDTRNGWELGGDSGAAIVPFAPAESPLIQAISHSGEMSEMPPDSRLSEQIVDDFRKWIADGASDPREAKSATRVRQAIDIEQGRKFWSFQPRPPLSDESQSIEECRS